MRRNGMVAMAAAVTVLAGAVPVHAQSWRADIGVNGGGSFYTSMLGSDAWNGSGDAVKFKPGWLAGAQLGVWFTPRIGIRANGTYTDAKLRQGSNELYDDVNLWSATGDLLIRFKTPAPVMTKMEMLPYIALGVGEKFIASAGGSAWNANGSNGIPFACRQSSCGGPGTDLFVPAQTFFLESGHRLMGLAGLGTDLRLAPNFGLRLEVGDRMYKPLIDAVGNNREPFPATLTAATTDVGKMVNEIYGQIGLHMLLGVAAPPVVAVTPTPAPEPPPPPPPPPPAAPATQNVSVCVVTPTAPAGLTSETAVYNPATGDTTIVVNGTPTPLRSAFTGVTTASGATWYVQGQPLTLGTGRTALAYVSFGTPRNVDISDLTYVGTVNGLPVYANKSDVTSLTIPTPPAEISADKGLMTGLRNVKVLYVPLTSYGCNFQPIQLQEQVRKVRG